MIERSTDKIYPKYDDFEDIEVSFPSIEDSHSSTTAMVVGFLCRHTTVGAIALLTLLVFGTGFWTTNNTWGLFAVDALIASFSVFAIIITSLGEARGRKKEETPCGTHESRNESTSTSDS